MPTELPKGSYSTPGFRGSAYGATNQGAPQQCNGAWPSDILKSCLPQTEFQDLNLLVVYTMEKQFSCSFHPAPTASCNLFLKPTSRTELMARNHRQFIHRWGIGCWWKLVGIWTGVIVGMGWAGTSIFLSLQPFCRGLSCMDALFEDLVPLPLSPVRMGKNGRGLGGTPAAGAGLAHTS